MKYRTLLIFAGLIIFIGAVIIGSRQNKPIEEPVQQKPTSAEFAEEGTEKIFEDPGIKQWGFGLVGDNGLCFFSQANEFKTYKDKGQTTIHQVDKPDSVNITSAGGSCLVQYFYQDRIDTFILTDDTGAIKIDGSVASAYANQEFFVLPTDKKLDIYDSKGRLVNSLKNDEGSILKAAPLALRTYLINNYDEDAERGSISLMENSKTTKIDSTEFALNIKATPKSQLLITGAKTTQAVLRDNTKEISRLDFPDSEHISTTPQGYLIPTKPNTELTENEGNSLIYLSDEGKKTYLLMTREGTSEIYNIRSAYLSQKDVYFTQNDAVYRLKNAPVK